MGSKQRFIVSLVLVSALMVGGLAHAGEPDLVGWWRLDDGSGTIARDSSGKGNDGTFVGTPEWVTGVFGGGLEFDGAGTERVALGNLDVEGRGISLMCWAYAPNLDTPGNDPRMISKATGGAADAHWWLLSSSRVGGLKVLRFRLLTTDGQVTTTHVAGPEGEIPLDEWFHAIAMWDGTDMRLFKNGVEVSSMAKGGDAVATDASVGAAFGNQPVGAEDRPWDGILDDVRIYSRALTQEEIDEVLLGAGPGANVELAASPVPADGDSDILRDTTLSWTAGEFANTHDVYLGTSLDDVNSASRDNSLGVLVSEGQAGTGFAPETVLTYGQTYYWRIDEVNAAPDNTIFKGNVWSFTVEPFAYPIESVTATASHAGPDAGPENTVNGSGLNESDQHSIEATDMWLAAPNSGEPVWIQYAFDRVYKLHEMLLWNYNVQFELVLGFGLKDVTIEYSEDGVDWSVLGDAELARGTASADYTANTTVDLQGIAAKFLRLNVNTGWGPMGQFGLSEVRILQIPVAAREPQPDDGAVDVDPETSLSWRIGREAAVHEVHFGTDEAAVVDGTALLDTVVETTVSAGSLDLGTRYYWKVNEVNEAEAVSVWPGPVWTFATQEYFVVDDFESYDDDENAIFDTWLDGFVNETGSTVGYFDAPFAEQTIVHGGGQSMPLEYANDAAPFYSEAERDLGSADWTANGADTLTLHVSGRAPAFFETAEGSILMNGIGNDIWGTADQFRYAYRTLTGDGSMTVRIDAIDGSPHGWVKGGAMIRQSTGVGSVNAFTALTGGSGDGATFQWRSEQDASSSSSRTLTGITPPYYARIVREGNTFTGYLSFDGVNWEQQGDSSVDVAMTDPVLIGLALTSHNVDQATSAEFSEVSFTGNVSASWEMAEIGTTQPDGNILDNLYVAVEDTSGNVAVVNSPDAGATGRSVWNAWAIPFRDLAGVNLSRVAIMYIGVGDRDNPSAGGSGLIFIDNIWVGHPASTGPGDLDPIASWNFD